MGRILAFAGPALSVPLADPLMTLIDTVCVGRAADTVQLAALGPNTVIFNFVNYGFSFMGIATLSVVARELAAGSREGATKALSHAVCVAVFAGVAAMEVMRLSARSLVSMAGAAAGAPFFDDAVTYLSIRAISAPAMLLTVVLQSSLLAQEESRAPAFAVLTASLVNIAGDILLVCVMGLGAMGAAWATVFSEVTAAIFLLVVLPRKGRLPLRPRFPQQAKDLAPFASIFGPLVVFKVAKNICYAMLQSAAMGLSVVECAAHQSVWVLWTVMSFMPEPLSQAAQALLPQRMAAAESGSAWPRRALQETLVLLIWAALGVGVVLAAVAGLLPTLVPYLLARDPALWTAMGSVAVPAAVSTVLSSLSCPLEGALLARQDVKYMAICMIFILGGLFAGLHGISSQGHGLGGIGLPLVWWWLVAFFTMRLAVAFPRLQRLFWKRNNKKL